MTGPIEGRAGFRKLVSRLLKWQVGARWYAIALLVGPLSMTAAVVVVALLLTPRLHVPGLFASKGFQLLDAASSLWAVAL